MINKTRLRGNEELVVRTKVTKTVYYTEISIVISNTRGYNNDKTIETFRLS